MLLRRHTFHGRLEDNASDPEAPFTPAWDCGEDQPAPRATRLLTTLQKEPHELLGRASPGHPSPALGLGVHGGTRPSSLLFNPLTPSPELLSP